MSALTSNDAVRPGPGGFKAWLKQSALACLPFGLALLRRFRPILRLGSTYVVTLHDDVREVFGTDRSFGVTYNASLQVITGNEPFFLGMSDTPTYRAQIQRMQRVVVATDLPALGDRAEAMAEALVAASNGQLEMVGFIRQITFDLLASYFGVPKPEQGHLDVWATRLFEFQFAGSPTDTALRDDVDQIAPAFRAHIDKEIGRRKAAGNGPDDILGRCLKLQAAGEPGYSDTEIRTALLCMVVGGPPQPPMALPQVMEQLLRRPDVLADACRAALTNDDAHLRDVMLEAMRFDPLAPILPRMALDDCVLAAGTRRSTKIPKGATILTAPGSAMMDERRLPDPQFFRPGRLPYEYSHFGYGLHQCFGRHINLAVLHRMLKPLLKRPGLRRAEGKEGRLRKKGVFADSLSVQFDNAES